MDDISPIDPHWGWLMLAVFLTTAEILVPGKFLIWFGAAAFVTGIATALIDIPFAAQLAIFAALAIVAVYAGRRRFGRSPVGPEEPVVGERTGRLVGRRGIVVETIAQGSGRIRLGDSVWLATGPDMAVGEAARVLAVDGLQLVVGPAGRPSRRPTKTALPSRPTGRRARSRSR
jgi:membrane protein implicated in regulation of membrane protease activity